MYGCGSGQFLPLVFTGRVFPLQMVGKCSSSAHGPSTFLSHTDSSPLLQVYSWWATFHPSTLGDMRLKVTCTPDLSNVICSFSMSMLTMDCRQLYLQWWSGTNWSYGLHCANFDHSSGPSEFSSYTWNCWLTVVWYPLLCVNVITALRAIRHLFTEVNFFRVFLQILIRQSKPRARTLWHDEFKPEPLRGNRWDNLILFLIYFYSCGNTIFIVTWLHWANGIPALTLTTTTYSIYCAAVTLG